MEIKKVSILSKDYKKISELLCKSLPEEEHLPHSIMYLLSLRKDIHYVSFYENDVLIGLLYTIETKDLDYILYLAVNPEIRSKGYGSKIIEWVKNRSKDKPVALDIEALEEDADNYEQRLKRYNFYSRLGFKETNYYVSYNDKEFIVLTNNDKFSKESFMKLFSSFTFNLYIPDIKFKAISE